METLSLIAGIDLLTGKAILVIDLIRIQHEKAKQILPENREKLDELNVERLLFQHCRLN